MSNMSYCRFRNTRKDLLDCRDALRELASANDDKLNEDELTAARGLVRLCASILVQLDEYAWDNDVLQVERDGGFDTDVLESDRYLRALEDSITHMNKA